MFGVVLWRSPQTRTAVIWCEDHGDLALFDDGESTAKDVDHLSKGDLVHVDIKVENGIRRVRSAAIVDRGHDPDLPERLMGAATATNEATKTTAEVPMRATSTVVPFPGPRSRAGQASDRADVARADVVAY